MKLEDQVCNLELSKRLKELGVKQECFFQWVRTHDKGVYPWKLDYIPANNIIPAYEWCAAFTVTELGEILKNDCSIFPKWEPREDKWRWAFYPPDPKPSIVVVEDTEADARAKMLIYLLEQGLVKV